MFNFIRKSIGFSYFRNAPERVNIKDPNFTLLDYLLDLKLPKLSISENVKINPKGDKSNVINVSPYLDNTIFTTIDLIVDTTDDDVTYKDNGEINDLFPYIPDGKYIFRKEIYDIVKREESVDIKDLTKYEKVFLYFINREPIEYQELVDLYENLHTLPTKELFYFVPVLISMLNWYVTTFSVPFI